MIVIKDGPKLDFTGTDDLSIRRLALVLRMPLKVVIGWIEEGYSQALRHKEWKRSKDGSLRVKF